MMIKVHEMALALIVFNVIWRERERERERERVRELRWFI